MCLMILQFDSIPISSFKSLSRRLYANCCVNAISLTRRTLWNCDVSLTYPKYALPNLEISFEGFGMAKTCLFELKNYLRQNCESNVGDRPDNF
ncbi:hypothetical protein HanIR_Chr10g0460261 [Helianthus annuus]|nr:hypothetical protein HanIR_Chr10g0460261 [Helianthus annuus]